MKRLPCATQAATALAGCGEREPPAEAPDSPLRTLMHFLVALRSCPDATDPAAGDISTTGTWTDAWPVQRGELWTARFNADLPALDVRFE